MLKTGMIFQDKMILQRGKEIYIWGTGEAGKEITIEIQGVKSSALIDGNGKWIISLAPLQASEVEKMEIMSGEERIVYNEVAIGEVWLAGGQSNMEFFMKYDKEMPIEQENCENPRIRFFDYPEVSYEGQLEDADYSQFGIWRDCNKENLPYYSAVGYYFAKQLEENLKVPVGIVGCNWGGTTGCSWLDVKYLQGNEGKAWLDDYDKAVENIDLEEYNTKYMKNPMNFKTNPLEDKMADLFMFGMPPGELEKIVAGFAAGSENEFIPEIGPKYEKRPGGLYEVMLKKIAPYAVKGFIWYQGESDDEKAEIYRTVFSSMIRCWRDLWKEELPFLFVQLAPFRKWLDCVGSRYTELRAQQEWVSEHVAGTGMAVITDVGMECDIHPKFKRPVGERLALLARGKVYSEDILCEAPKLISAKLENGKLILEFANAEGGLILKGSNVNALEILRDNDKVTEYVCTVLDTKLILESNIFKLGRSIEVSLACAEYYEVNLYSKAGIPARPGKIVLK